MTQKFFAATHKQDAVCQKSSSGGAFSAITDAWFQKYSNHAVVYGCVFDDRFRAKHIRGTDAQDRDRMRGSKYIGSDMTGIMRQVASDLKDGKYVVFSGTPCQVAGLKSFLKAKMVGTDKQLLTIEVICHGVGSVRFFEDYLRHLERGYKSKAKNVTFRAKNRPGKKQDIGITFENGKRYVSTATKYDWFYSAYLRNYILRPSCYHCAFAQEERYADISIADHWGDSDNALRSRSLIVINTEQGWTAYQAAQAYLNAEMISDDRVHQLHMKNPPGKPDRYDQFWEKYRSEGYLQAQRMLGNNTLAGHFRAIVLKILYMMHLIEMAKCVRVYCRKVLERLNG